jgi:hypothetical protein
MKFLFIAHMMLIDCGKASKQTKGQPTGFFTEVGSPPATRYNT